MKLLKFYGTYCKPCKVLADRLSKIELDIPLIDYDVEEEIDLTEEWKVRNVPTVILVDDNGHEVKRLVGNFEPNVELKAFIKNETN